MSDLFSDSATILFPYETNHICLSANDQVRIVDLNQQDCNAKIQFNENFLTVSKEILEFSSVVQSSWFFPKLSTICCEHQLKLKNIPGSFLVNLPTKSEMSNFKDCTLNKYRFIPYILSVVDLSSNIIRFRISCFSPMMLNSKDLYKSDSNCNNIPDNRPFLKLYSLTCHWDNCKNVEHKTTDFPIFQSLFDLIHFYKTNIISPLSFRLTKSACSGEDPRLRYLEMKKFKIPFYQVVFSNKIGSGEFADVFLALFNEKNVAVKCPKQNDNEKLELQFIHEAYLLSQFDHPNILKFFGFYYRNSPCQSPIYVDSRSPNYVHSLFTPPSGLGLLIEYMQIGCLLHYLQTRGRNVIEARQLLNFCQEVASAMSYLEARGFIHRDLAARNVLIDTNLSVKVSDFGMMQSSNDNTSSASIEDLEDFDKKLAFRWPLKWTAPEALKYHSFSHKSDSWSYGIFLWEVFSYGRIPYPEILAADVLEFLENGNRLGSPKDCPPAIYKLMLSCWEDDPIDRPSLNEISNIISEIVI